MDASWLPGLYLLPKVDLIDLADCGGAGAGVLSLLLTQSAAHQSGTGPHRPHGTRHARLLRRNDTGDGPDGLMDSGLVLALRAVVPLQDHTGPQQRAHTGPAGAHDSAALTLDTDMAVPGATASASAATAAASAAATAAAARGSFLQGAASAVPLPVQAAAEALGWRGAAATRTGGDRVEAAAACVFLNPASECHEGLAWEGYSLGADDAGPDVGGVTAHLTIPGGAPLGFLKLWGDAWQPYPPAVNTRSRSSPPLVPERGKLLPGRNIAASGQEGAGSVGWSGQAGSGRDRPSAALESAPQGPGARYEAVDVLLTLDASGTWQAPRGQSQGQEGACGTFDWPEPAHE
ncbi:hypothetical protein HYH03_018665 [Edaphochlamys debaryana]|uniref:Uncharacterized protein n=1 Tax=Edaphochlamys debaryana TaxID=47281 RepID=A0A835XLG3_9CHLO|nr:hypothetical protein HYH03_018665 [Edaphochlamys debaryana]|eukprot:KAG2482404.1 hypothetical protein HYH03_018665 [Edaphochlamys debaryana]